MSEEDIKRWRTQAAMLEDGQIELPTIPIEVFLMEAGHLAGFVRDHWSPATDGSRPGLDSVGEFLDQSIGDELTSLSRACRELHSLRICFGNYAEEEDETEALCNEATAILESLGSAVNLVLDGDIDKVIWKAIRTQLGRMTEVSTLSTLSKLLADYASIAESVQGRLLTLGGFDEKEITRAAELANLLGEMCVLETGRPASEDIEVRNRYLTLLVKQVGDVRRAACYVFRRHPKIATQATSAYERRRRIELKRKKLEEAASS